MHLEDQGADAELERPALHRRLLVIVGILTLLAAVGMVALWPRGGLAPEAAPDPLTVLAAVTGGACPPPATRRPASG